MPGSLEKDAITAALGAAAALAGLVLVFEGVTLAAIQAYPGDTPRKVTAPLRTTAWLMVGVFAASLLSVGVSFVWLLLSGPGWLYGYAVGLFLFLLGLVLVVASYSVRQLTL